MSKVAKHFYAIIFCSIIIAPTQAWSYVYNINVDTSSLAGTNATLAFDFIDGDGIINNTIQVNSFLTDGNVDLDLTTLEGDASGTLNSSFSLGDNSFFNELLQPITLGNSLQFDVYSSNLFASSSLVPDAFTFFILDSSGSHSLFATTDPTSSDALFALDLNGTDTGLAVFGPVILGPNWTVQAVPEPVPLPGAFSMMLVAGAFSTFLNRKRRALQ